jgi:hypothetical protein
VLLFSKWAQGWLRIGSLGFSPRRVFDHPPSRPAVCPDRLILEARRSLIIARDPMDRHGYEQEIKAAFEGEIWGEAFFLALASSERPAEQRRRLLILARLETETGLAMQQLADRLGLNDGDRQPHLAAGAERAAPWQELDWREAMQRLKAMIAPYVERYDALAAAARPEDHDILNQLAAHERALLIFAERELAGDSEQSLDAVLALLEKTA